MRLFVALNLPPAERDRIHRAARPLRESGWPVRWVGRDQLHVTLKFLGVVPDEREAEIARAVEAAAAAVGPFEFGVGGVGAFPSLRRPRVLWLGVEPAPEMEALWREIEQRFERLGFAREGRPFRPHVTLGRVNRAPGAAARPERLARAAERVDYRARIRVETLDLMESRLRPTGAEYEVRHAAPLRGAPSGGHAGAGASAQESGAGPGSAARGPEAQGDGGTGGGGGSA
jgi:2'-5' RNA ligase